MRKLVFLQKEPLSRLCVAFLLTAGITLPLLVALELGAHLIGSLAITLGLQAALTVLNATKRSRRLLWGLLAVLVAAQFFIPNAGLLGTWLEAFKALALYFSGYTVALPLYGGAVAGLVTLCAAVLGYVFAKRGVGFLPAAAVVLLVMFGLWSLGRGELLWYVAPALVALLLQMSQAAHEKINVLHVLPMALAAVLLAFLLLPAGRITLEPLSSAARSLKQMISDYLFFTEPRNVFTLGTYGYYPMGGNQLGGEAEPSEYPVMIVKTDRKTLLRAVVKDNYTGRSFTDTSSAKRYLYINPRWEVQRRKAFLELLPSEAIRKASGLLDEKAVAVQIQNRAASTVFTPLFLRSLNTSSDMVPYFNDASELFITRDLQQGDKYTVFTPLLEGGDAGLEALVDASRKGEDNFAAIVNGYTQLPAHMEQKVRDDVSNMVRGAKTPYAKAMAIMRHLQKYYRYTLTPDTPPSNKDFVTYFLYVGKEGYCTYYAAAMTVLCRMAGLPTRYVEGFLAMPEADGFAYVTGMDAHAWTEVYFEGFGWIPFDPTPVQQTGSNPPESQQSPEPSPTPSPEDQPTPTPDPDTPPDQPSSEPQPSEAPEEQNEDPTPETQPEDPSPLLWVLLALATLLAALAARMAARAPGRVASRMPTEKEKIFVYGAAVKRLLVYAKRAPKDGETPLAFARRVDSVRVFPSPITPLWRMLALSNYSRMEPNPEHTQKAADTFRMVFKGSHALRRLHFLLAAAFDPRFYHGLDTPAPQAPPPKPFPFKVPRCGHGKVDNGVYAKRTAGAKSVSPGSTEDSVATTVQPHAEKPPQPALRRDAPNAKADAKATRLAQQGAAQHGTATAAPRDRTTPSTPPYAVPPTRKGAPSPRSGNASASRPQPPTPPQAQRTPPPALTPRNGQRIPPARTDAPADAPHKPDNPRPKPNGGGDPRR